MEYQQFVSAVKDAVCLRADDSVDVQIHTTVKNNGTKRKGLLFQKSDNRVSPAIYLEEYYQRFRQENGVEGEWRDGDVSGEIDAIGCEILDYYHQVLEAEPEIPRTLGEYTAVRKRLIYKVIHYEKNQEMLRDIPHTRQLDLAMVYQILLDSNPEGLFTITITNQHLEQWQISREELIKDTQRTVADLLPAVFDAMDTVLRKMGEEVSIVPGDNLLYMLSNDHGNLGAGALFYPQMQEHIYRELGEPYYVLPSSIHEVLIVPASKSPGIEELREMVGRVNETQLAEEEILSDTVYYYDEKSKRLLQ